MKFFPLMRLRLRAGGDTCIQIGPAQWHPVGTIHTGGSDTSPPSEAHRRRAGWCVPIALLKGGWGGDVWVPRWWKKCGLWGPRQTIKREKQRHAAHMAAEEERHRAVIAGLRRREAKYRGLW